MIARCHCKSQVAITKIKKHHRGLLVMEHYDRRVKYSESCALFVLNRECGCNPLAITKKLGFEPCVRNQHIQNLRKIFINIPILWKVPCEHIGCPIPFLSFCVSTTV